MFILSLLFSFLSGLLISIHGLINSLGGKAIGSPAMFLWLSLVQAIPALIIMIVRPQKLGFVLSLQLGFKWYLFSAIIGLVIFTILSFSISNVGAGTAFVLVVLGQIIGSTIADQFGLFGSPVRPVNTLRIISIVIIMAGVFLLLKSNSSSEAVKSTQTITIEKQIS
nr:DMT family transporter [Neobacillus sp. Marseille-Q6967]